ncbi:hypothetical protein PHYPSEUDO_012114 [Phytophthora pseudosyringae]|uniref:Uncharacterized protein n=1 Tax=Phytophthora pseudosyringae TaxID=221518 RepID=A0A8T1W922_9STRA|nr:hypothetical protein PHYPSEUDO_012114 [Phytophthora pseudosyringae]
MEDVPDAWIKAIKDEQVIVLPSTCEDLREHLLRALHVKYDAAPYIFGYAAVGLRVRLLAIRKDDMTERGAKAETIETYNLGDLNSRISFFLALLNLSTLFRPVVDLIEPLDVPEYGIIERGNGVQITFAEDCVMKTYPQSMPSDDIIRNLRELHRQMKMHSVPNVVELKKTKLKKKYVKLAPVGQLPHPKTFTSS